MSSADKKKPSQERRPWRDNLEALTMAIVMAVMLKYFAVEAYKIPTGSMQPTLLGNDDVGVYDRILVDKLSFHFRDPERFEVCVFKYPLDRSKTFIKRVCGMPGEDFAIRHGDLWTRPNGDSEWKVLRRPRPVQTEVWREIDAHDPRFSSWRAVEETKGWTSSKRERVSARGSGAMRLPNDSGPIWDNYGDGYDPSMSQRVDRMKGARMRNPIGDLRLSGDIAALSGTKSVTIELREGSRRYRFEIPGPASASDSKPRIAAESLDGTTKSLGEALAGAAWKLSTSSTGFAVQNMDDELQLEIDGDIVATLDIEASSDQAASVTLRVDGEGADFDDLELARDIYYTEGTKSREFKIPAQSYVMLGDNTQDSSDSREWQFVKYRWPGEGSNGAWIRGNWFPTTNPIQVTGEVGGMRVFLRDEWGELYDFLSPPGERESSLDAAPFVSRDLMIGRAVLVFWPHTIVSVVLEKLGLSGGKTPLLWRLQWIH